MNQYRNNYSVDLAVKTDYSNMSAIWKAMATVEFLKAKNKTSYIFHISVKAYIPLSDDDIFNWFFQVCTKLSPLVKIYCLLSEILYIFGYFFIILVFKNTPFLSTIDRRNQLYLASA